MMVVVSGFSCQSTHKSRDASRPPKMGRVRFDFEESPTGAVPDGWHVGQTNPTTALATWKVIEDSTAPSAAKVCALTATKNYDGTFNLAIAEDTSFKDVDLTVKVKAVGGQEDQGGGPVWRYQDDNNYYICRYNPLESNFRVYFVKDGKRKQLDSVKIDTSAGRWYTLRVQMVDRHITCSLDGEQLLTAEDDTFTQPGKIGLWTKADAVTSFDDFEATENKSSPGD